MNEVSKNDKKDLKNILSEELFAEFQSYSTKQQLYLKYRGVGVSQEQAWKKASLPIKNARQNASAFESNHPLSKEIIKRLQVISKLDGLSDKDSPISKEITNNIARGKDLLQIIGSKEGVEAEQLKFYLDVVNGEIKQKKKTITTDKSTGKVTEKVEEIEASVSEKIKAREKLDQILGLDDVQNILGEVEVNKDITIKIVDTTAPKDMLEEVPVMDAEIADSEEGVEDDE